MKKKGMYRLGIVGLVLAAASAAWMQTPDLAGLYDFTSAQQASKIGAMHANALDSGTRVNRAGYQAVALLVAVTQSDITSGVGTGDYILLIDSTPGVQAWVPQDSVPLDSTDSKVYKLTYRGVRQWVRTVVRASGAAADTVAFTAVFMLGNKRARP